MASVPYVNVGINSVLGTNTVLPNSGTGIAKSYAYDEAQYAQTDSMTAYIGTDTASVTAYMPAFTAKQVKSITVVPVVAPGAIDFIQLTLYSMQPQVFGTATATTCYNIPAAGTPAVAGATIAASTPGWLGTVMGTSVNKVQITTIVGNGGTGVGGASGTMAFGLGTMAIYNPTYVNLAGATATIVVFAPAGTNTQAGYVFPTGPSGGLSMAPGDILAVNRGTASGAYVVEVECTFAPSGSVTR